MVIAVVNGWLCRARFHPQFSEKDAAKAIGEVVETARLNFRFVVVVVVVSFWCNYHSNFTLTFSCSHRTYSYDVLQDIQQKIYYHKKADQ